MRAELKEFYQQMLVWVEAGCPDDQVDGWSDVEFDKDMGLCCNLYEWAEEIYGEHLACELHDLQKRMFTEAGLDNETPFNYDLDDYCKSSMGAMGHYSNAERLNWIKEHAQ